MNTSRAPPMACPLGSARGFVQCGVGDREGTAGRGIRTRAHAKDRLQNRMCVVCAGRGVNPRGPNCSASPRGPG